MKEFLNKKSVKILSVVLAALLVTGGVTGVVYAASNSAGNSAPEDTTALDNTITDVIQINNDTGSDDKEETVYAIADANGNVQETIVSDWLKNPDGLDTLADYTELNDIQNTKGDETYTSTGDNTYEWNAAGNSIHYQGTTDKALPVTTRVSYLLDGNEIQPEDLAGKSGHVTIRFDYANTQAVSANIDGETQDIFVPFLMVSGVILDGDTFSNVTVSSGSVFNDGSRNVVIGYALPGLSESLDITDEDLDIPECVEIEADTTDFSLAGTLTVAMTDLFDGVEINSDSDIAELSDSLKELEDAAYDLVDGASDLYAGSTELYDSCGELQSGVGTLLSGAKDLEGGAGDVDSGAAALRDGLGKLSKNSGSLDSGAKDIVDAIFETATTQLRQQLVDSGLMTSDQAAAITLTRSNYVTVFQQLSGAVTVTPGQVESQLRAQLSAAGITNADLQSLTLTIAYDLMTADPSLAYTDALTQAGQIMNDANIVQTACAGIDATWISDHALLISQVKSATGITDDLTAAKITAVALYLDSSNPAGKIADAVTILSNASISAGTTPSADKITALCTAIASAATSTGNAQLDAVKSQLDDIMTFYNGLLSYTDGVDSAYTGSKELAEGTSSLKNGAEELYSGIYKLYAGSKELVSGAGELNDGCLELKNGAKDFYDDGIEKLVDSLDGDYQGLIDRLRAVADAGRNYQSFAGISGDMSGRVKFIYRTDSVGD